MTSARNQPFFKKYNINIGCYDGFSVCPRKITEKKKVLYMYKKHFCLLWKSQGIAFNKAIEELKLNFEVIDNVISDKLVKNFNIYEYKPKKVPAPLTKIVVYDLEQCFSTVLLEGNT